MTSTINVRRGRVATLSAWGELVVGQFPHLSRSWSALICALSFSLASAAAAYRLAEKPATYPDFIVGMLAWTASGKSQDYWFLGAFVAASLLSMAGLAILRAAMLSGPGSAMAEGFETILGAACIPALIWAGGLLLTRNGSLSLLNLTVTASLLTILAGTLLLLRRSSHGDTPQITADTIGGVLVIHLGAFLAVLGLGVLVTRLAVIAHWNIPNDIIREMRYGYYVSLGAALVASAATVALAPDGETLRARLRKILLAFQVPMVGLSFILVPALKSDAGAPPLVSPALLALVAVIAVVWLTDLVRRWRKGQRATILSALSPLSLIAVVLVVKTPTGYPPVVPIDDYHYGELLLPWWSLAKHHMIPYWDFAPSRGLLSNYLPGLLTDFFFDGTAADFTNAHPILNLTVLLLTFFPLALVVGGEAAFLMLLLAPTANGLSEIDLVNAGILALLCFGFTRWTPTRWLSLYAVISVAAVLLAAGQGALMALALSPLALCQLWRGWREERKRMLTCGALLAGALLVLGVATPLGLMVLGAIRYGAEQSSINSVAHGIPWSAGINAQTIGNQWLWEAGRASWIVAASIAGVLGIGAVVEKDPRKRKATIAFAIPVFLLAVLYIIRAAGRIDPGDFSRLGFATIWFWALLVPLLLYVAVDSRRRLGALAVCAIFASTIPFSDIGDVAKLAYQPTHLTTMPSEMVDGRSVGLPNFGRGLANESHVKRLVGLRRALDKYLSRDETYLDMTNHNADYFYLDRPPPIEASAVYNLVHADEQVRAVQSLADKHVPLALADAQTYLHDNVPISLRVPLLYRYVALTYVPFRDADATWLVRPDRLAGMGLPPQIAGHPDEKAMALLDKAFGANDLKDIPFAWGQSARSLSAKMHAVKSLAAPIGIAGVQSLDGESFAVTGPHPTIAYSTDAIRGRHAGLLAFDFKCDGGQPSIPLGINWTVKGQPRRETPVLRLNGRQGRLIVPLDSAPRWLLADDITDIRLEILDSASCNRFEIKGAGLFQRAGAAD